MIDDSRTREIHPPTRRAPVVPGDRSNPFWGAVIGAGFAFAVTCLASVVASFGDARGPMNQWAIHYGTTVVAVEAGVLIASALLAMTVDRVLTVRQLKQRQTQRHAVSPLLTHGVSGNGVSGNGASGNEVRDSRPGDVRT